ARRASPSTMAPSSPATVPAPANVGAYRLLATRDDVVAGHASKVLVYGGPGAGGDVTLVAWKSEGEAAHDVKRDEAGAATVDYWNDGATEYWATGLRGADVEAFVAAYRNAPG
ncbi:MAG: hypothetical protein KGQ28_11495, partial [Hyphomicrobiales bacterium]|nr:hypothetical protein [Hyphomicrobiales bacterium]